MAKSDNRPAACRICGENTKAAHYITTTKPGLIIWQRVCVDCKRTHNAKRN